MKTRIISGICVGLIGGIVIWCGGMVMDITILLMAAMSLFEFYRAFEQKQVHAMWPAGLLFILLLGGCIFFGDNTPFTITATIRGTEHNLFPPLLLLIFLLILALFVVCHKKYTVGDGAITLLGGMYIVILISYFSLLRNMKSGLWLFLLALIGAVAADTCAFFTGRALGRKKLIPEVSPNKTIAGSIGAFVGTPVILVVYGIILQAAGVYSDLALWHYADIGLLAGGAAQVGDLTASAIKRYAGVKDFGKIIPGHGGILDRIDSYLYVIPIIYYYIVLLGR